jgi:hypothetical protein
MRLELHWFDREATATERVLFVTDLLMLFLILINLGFFVFDWAFGHALYRNFVYSLSPSFYDYYAREIHPNFILYDATFVAIYISEIILRWILALVRQTYVRWYFYPLVHWYDVLGCIPSGSFRWLRLLRVFAIVTRMHKLGVIDLRKTLFFEQALHLWDIFLEEITDRVFLQLLEAAKQEILKESDSTESPFNAILKPHRAALSRWITKRVRHVTEVNYLKYRDELKALIENTVREAFATSKQMQKVEKVPLVGKQLTHALQATLEDIAFQLLDTSAKNVYERNGQLYEEALNSTFETLVKEEKDEEMSRIMKQLFADAIDKLKADIGEKRWMNEG